MSDFKIIFFVSQELYSNSISGDRATVISLFHKRWEKERKENLRSKCNLLASLKVKVSESNPIMIITCGELLILDEK